MSEEAALNESIEQPIDASSAEFAEAFGRTVQVIRTHRGWSRTELARQAGISYSYLSAIETGTKQPSAKMQLVIAGALGVSLGRLIELAEARLHPSGPDPELTRAAELDMALSRRDQRLAARYAMSLPSPDPDTPDDDPTDLAELQQLYATLSPADRTLILETARRLATGR